MKITKTKSYKAAFTGIAAAVAITLSFLEGLIPVSYTHLDVYKRQV